MQLLHIPGTWPMLTNTFLIFTGAGNAIVVDPAADAGEYLRRLEEKNARLTHILLTHGHYDHVGAVAPLKKATGAAVYMDKRDAAGDQMYPLHPADIDSEWPQGDELQIDELNFKIWHTPGHTQGSVCIYCDGQMFSGDTLFAGSCGRTDLPGGSTRDIYRSLSLLANLPLADETIVMPGHGEFTTLGRERRSNPYMLSEQL